MNRKALFLFPLLGLVSSLMAAPVPRAGRLAQVDAEGVMRWTDDNSEVALFGVNYYPPFTVDYKAIKEKGLDFDRVMREDVAHFRRLGLTSLRIHCFDRQFSTHEGAFVANHHIELLDKLIDLCARNGIYTILTPIAWWGGSYAEDKEGFSNDWPMKEMTANRKSWPIQARFLKEFGEHVNPLTGKRYADDPAILCFELINEPLYPKGHPDSEVTAYIDALADGLRASGTKKPIFYNSWQRRNAAAGKARIDGVTGSYYPTGLVAGHALRGPQLAHIKASSLHPDEHIARKAKMIYEFDCADTPGAYMYPAMAKLFRHEGVQIANQFQYDPLCIADVNAGWMTHHLSLVYTPAKALAFGIAAEAFRRLPRNCAYTNAQNEIVFPPFRVNAERNLSQMTTETDYLYTADPIDPPPAPEKLSRIWGVGTSSVAGASGNGAYFLDKARDGVWRLQLYPDVFNVRDEYSGGKSVKQILLPGPRAVTLSLPDLGSSFRVRAAADGREVARADGGHVLLAPGDYIVENVPTFGEKERGALVALDTPAYVAREPSHETHVSADPPAQWNASVPLPLDVRTCGARDVRAYLMFTAKDEQGRTIYFPELHAPDGARAEMPGTSLSLLPPAGTQPRMSLMRGVACEAKWEKSALAFETAAASGANPCDGFSLPVRLPPAGTLEAGIRLSIENRLSTQAALEIGFRLKANGGFGAVVFLAPGMNEITLEPSMLNPLWGYTGGRDWPWNDVVEVSFLTGGWIWRSKEMPAQKLVIHSLERFGVSPAFSVNLRTTPSEWEFFDVAAALRRGFWGVPGVRKYKTIDPEGRSGLGFAARAGAFAGEKDYVGQHMSCDAAAFRQLFGNAGEPKAVLFRARATDVFTKKIEFVFKQRDGGNWGVDLPLTTEWRTLRVPVKDLRPYWNTKRDGTTKPAPQTALGVALGYGRWLYQDSLDKPHGFEISSVKLEF